MGECPSAYEPGATRSFWSIKGHDGLLRTCFYRALGGRGEVDRDLGKQERFAHAVANTHDEEHEKTDDQVESQTSYSCSVHSITAAQSIMYNVLLTP